MRTAPKVSIGNIPLLTVAGTAFECGEQLGFAWRDSLKLAGERLATHRPHWKLLDKYAPHLTDVYRGMARGSGLTEDKLGLPSSDAGCTTFAIHPRLTRDGIPISGQTKDTPARQAFYSVVLKMNCTNGPSLLTYTYPGWLFGHGFVTGGCAVFRNSLRAPPPTDGLPYEVWGLLALHCRRVGDAIELTRRHSPQETAHCTVADEQGGIVGLEITAAGVGARKPEGGLYIHANAIHTPRLRRVEEATRAERANSLLREARLRERLEAERGRLTAALAYQALSDHVGWPRGVCVHASRTRVTTAAVVVEPTQRRLHVCRGNPCENWPVTYEL